MSFGLYHSQAFSIQGFAVLSRVDEVLGFFAGFVLGNRSLPVKTRENHILDAKTHISPVKQPVKTREPRISDKTPVLAKA